MSTAFADRWVSGPGASFGPGWAGRPMRVDGDTGGDGAWLFGEPDVGPIDLFGRGCYFDVTRRSGGVGSDPAFGGVWCGC